MSLVRPESGVTRTLAILCSAAFLSACSVNRFDYAPKPDRTNRKPHWIAQHSGVTVGLRGVCAVSGSIAWASGAKGTWLRTIDGGTSWEGGVVRGAEALDFRDIHAFDERTAAVLSAGLPAKVYRTVDAGESWSACYSSSKPGVFFDAMAFWDDRNGIAFSDPVDGSLLIIRTSDAGRSWRAIPPRDAPAVRPGEAGFAASGTCLAVWGTRDVWIGLGGSAARVFHSRDRGLTWSVADTPITSGNPSSGIFSIAFRDATHGVAVGGDYQRGERGERNTARTQDGGESWQSLQSSAPHGYRSCVAYVPARSTPTLVAVGTTGSDYSTDDGLTWRSFDARGYDAVGFARDGAGFAVGADGRVARLSWNAADD